MRQRPARGHRRIKVHRGQEPESMTFWFILSRKALEKRRFSVSSMVFQSWIFSLIRRMHMLATNVFIF